MGAKELYAARRIQGLCGSCGKQEAVKGKAHCAPCKASFKAHREKNPLKGRWRRALQFDQERGFVGTVTLLEFMNIVANNPCAYCGFVATGLDRVDNERGHRPGNVLPCCAECNKARGDYFTVLEMMEIIGPAIKLAKGRRS